jgi:hypothetical protein
VWRNLQAEAPKSPGKSARVFAAKNLQLTGPLQRNCHVHEGNTSQAAEDHSAGHGGMALGSTSQATVLFQLRLKRPQIVMACD